MSKKKFSKTHQSNFHFWFRANSFSLLSFFILSASIFLLNHITPTYPLVIQHDEYMQPLRRGPVLGSTTNNHMAFNGNRKSKQIALTFDADMTPGMQHMLVNGSVASFYDSTLIDILKKTKTKATLFMTGLWIESYPKEAKALGKNSLFELANHSYSHGGFSGDCYGLSPIGDSKDKEEIQKTQNDLKKIAGVKSKFFRFPGGCYDSYDLGILNDMHLTPVQWDSVAHDGFNQSAENIEENVLSSVQNGSIIVMHMNGYPNEPETAKAVAYLIPELKKRGFSFVKLSELLRNTPITAFDLRLGMWHTDVYE